jgi:hypothetical protein
LIVFQAGALILLDNYPFLIFFDYFQVKPNGGPVSSVTDSLGLTWTKRASVASACGVGFTEEEWTAVGPTCRLEGRRSLATESSGAV